MILTLITARQGEVPESDSEGRDVSLPNLLGSRGGASKNPTDGPGDDRRARPVSGAEERAGAEPGRDAVDPVVAVSRGDHGALDPSVHEADDPERVADAAPRAAAGVEDAVGPDLGGLPGLGAAGGVAEPHRGPGHGAAEVADARVVGEVLAPGPALRDGLLLEEELRGGGKVVELPVGEVEVLVRVVEAALGAGVGGVAAVVGPGPRRVQPRVGHRVIRRRRRWRGRQEEGLGRARQLGRAA